MKKIFPCCLFLLFFICGLPLTADDGSWGSTFSVLGGSIYSETENPDISLEKEFLVFDGEKTVVHFQFRNTSSFPVTQDCGFPVRHTLETSKGEGFLLVRGWLPESAGKYFETVQVYDPDNEDQADSFWGFDPAGILINSANNRRDFIGLDDASAEVSFQIEQDGKPVQIKDVLVERYVGDDGARLIFHFRHKLNFGPDSVSMVKVEYSQDLRTGSDGVDTEYYGWNYVIGTGATWKGPISGILFICPSSWEGSVPGLHKLIKTDFFTAFGARDYLPDRQDCYYLSAQQCARDHREQIYLADRFPDMKKLWISKSVKSKPSESPAQDFIQSFSASSFLPDTLTIFREEMIIEKAGYGPISAFDGFGETSWCENKPDDGLDEYLECMITCPVWGLAIKNGYTRFPAQDWMFRDQTFEKLIRDDSLGLKDYFTMNNRVKELAISKPDGPVLFTLHLKDQRDPQIFPWVFLKPGTYRFAIKSIYPGTKWKDTCLGDICFFTSESEWLDFYWQDPFFSKHLREISFR